VIVTHVPTEQQDGAIDTKLLPSTFDPEYVEGAVRPFFLSGTFMGEHPLLPMIGLTFSKQAAMSAHLFGMLYDEWRPNPEKEGTTVFLTEYDDRGPNNERKRIYFSATTPDLYTAHYSPKVTRFLDQLFDTQNAGRPLMRQYFDRYFDLYWDLHLSVTGDAIPAEVRQIGHSFMAVLGYWFPTLQVVHDNYMQVRRLRPLLKGWIDQRVQDLIDGRVPHPEATLVYYWVKNGEFGENFRRKDIVFECFHNFLAFSQWGNMLYNVMARLEPQTGDPVVRSWFARTIEDGPDETDGSAFTRLDRFVMELFRTISPNAGSVSALPAQRQALGAGYTGFNTIVTPHPETSRDPVHWSNPDDFDPDRYKQVPTSEQNDEARCQQVGFTQCPFIKEEFHVKDGRNVAIANSTFGAVYARVDDQVYPLCDDAGYAPLGFGYRRCAGEFINNGFFEDLLRKVWRDKITFTRLDSNHAEMVAVGPRTVVDDNIGFTRG
jgi:hypothetical protein